MKSFSLRVASEQDIPKIVGLNRLMADYHHEIDPFWKPGSELESFNDYLSAELSKKNTLWVLAEVEGVTVAYFSAEIIPAKPAISEKMVGHISNGFVLERYRGKGIAKGAIAMILNWFREQGVKVAELSVDSRNGQGVRAWEGLGFKEYMKKMKMNL